MPAWAAGVPSIGAITLGTPPWVRNFDADTAEFTADIGLGLPVLPLVHVVGVGIETGEHPLQRILGQQVGSDRMDIVALNDLHDPRNELDFDDRSGPTNGCSDQRDCGKTGGGDADGDQMTNFSWLSLSLR